MAVRSKRATVSQGDLKKKKRQEWGLSYLIWQLRHEEKLKGQTLPTLDGHGGKENVNR